MAYPRICYELGMFYIGWMKSIPTEMRWYMAGKEKDLMDNLLEYQKEICLQNLPSNRQCFRNDSCVLRIWIWRKHSRISIITVVRTAWAAVNGGTTATSTALMIYCTYKGAPTTNTCILLQYVFIKCVVYVLCVISNCFYVQ